MAMHPARIALGTMAKTRPEIRFAILDNARIQLFAAIATSRRCFAEAKPSRGPRRWYWPVLGQHPAAAVQTAAAGPRDDGVSERSCPWLAGTPQLPPGYI